MQNKTTRNATDSKNTTRRRSSSNNKNTKRNRSQKGAYKNGKIASSKSEYKGKYTSNKADDKIPFFKTPVKRIWDVRLWTPIFIIILVMALNIKENKLVAKYENEINIMAQTMVEAVQETVPEETQEAVTEPTMSEEEQDIVALAILADTVGHGKTDEVKVAIMWVAINRSEDTRNGYGLSLREEIARPKQWQQYDPEGVYLASTYSLAESVYYTWKNNGPRPMYNDMLWFTFNSDGTITVRNVFSGDKNRSQQTFGSIV